MNYYNMSMSEMERAGQQTGVLRHIYREKPEKGSDLWNYRVVWGGSGWSEIFVGLDRLAEGIMAAERWRKDHS